MRTLSHHWKEKHVAERCKYCRELYPMQRDWVRQVFSRRERIDPNNEEDWYSLALGYALGKGVSVTTAHQFALHIRYHTPLG